MGAGAVEMIVRHSKGETVPDQMLIPTSLYRKSDGEKDPALR
jgi:ABC-type sugar transport system substrate-binding protein